MLGKSCKTLRNVWYMSACNGILTGMKQSSLDLNLSTKRTRKQELLAQMELMVPWAPSSIPRRGSTQI